MRSGHQSLDGGVAASLLSNKRLTLPFVVLLAALAVGLLFLLPGGILQAQDSTNLEYAENGDGPVATFTAEDPEGVTPITWTFATSEQIGAESGLDDADNADSVDFMIDTDGILKFAIDPGEDGSSPGSPDYENPQGAGPPANNTYNVVVVACDVALDADDDCPDTGEAGYHKVTVKVTKVDEPGKITWTVNPNGTDDAPNADILDTGNTPILQFQVGAVLTVPVADGVTDGDRSDADKNVTERLQWYRSPSKTATGTAIDGETAATYAVKPEDVDKYIRVVAFYNISTTAREESASRTSDYPVLGTRSSNEAPEFDPDEITREVSEGKKGRNVGARVTATDDRTNALNYTLGGTDAAKFKIDQKTGQITTMEDLNREHTETDAAPNFGCGANYECDEVTVIATDSAGLASEAADVTIKLTNVDEKPKFTTEADALSPMTIMTPENRAALFDTTEGDVTYAAEDEDGSNVTWSLMGADRTKFQLSGSRVLSFKAKPDYEMPADSNRDNVYEVTVRGADGTKYADRMVKVTVTDVDEGPEITGKDSVTFAENGDGPVATFTAEDPEGVTPITWTFATSEQIGAESGLDDADNADSVDFMIDTDGILKFAIDPGEDGSSPGSPDYENPQGAGPPANNTYNVVVVACDVALDADDDCPDTGEAGYHKVTVKVTKVDEPGKVTWTVSPDGELTPADVNGGMPIVQFQVGAILTASATDGDITDAAKSVADNVRREWYRGSAKIANETAATYTVKPEDLNKRIRVVVYYTVGAGTEESASRMSDYPVLGTRSSNEAPEFDPDEITREVSEGKKGRNVGARVTATDDRTNALNYTLGGTDAAKFKIDQKTGQITTMEDLNREHTETDAAPNFGCGANYECDEVTVIATDSAGLASEAADVTIKLTNVDEKPKFTTEADALSPMTIMTPENRAALFDTTEGDVTYAAMDEDELNVNLSLMGPDGGKFSLGTGGVLSFKAGPDFEMPTDTNKDNVYEVTVRASDGTKYADRMVKVTVTEVDEAPEIVYGGLGISGMSSVERAEGPSTAVATYMAAGPEASSARWSLSGDDRGDFSIGSSTGVLTFRSAPDYENPTDMGMDNMYMVTIMANDGTYMDTHDVAVTVTNVDEDGTVTLSPQAPRVGAELTATLTDLDGGITETTWQWARSDAMDGTFTDIDGAMSMSYTPVDPDDVGKYLRAMVSYTDGESSGKSANMVSANAVASVPVIEEDGYDHDKNGVIDREEALDAVDDYFDFEIEKEQMLAVVLQYVLDSSSN